MASRYASTAITRRLTSASWTSPSFWNTEPTCFSTARSLMNSAFAVAALLRPVASSCSTSSSRSVSPRRAELVSRRLAGQQPLDDLRVERGPAARHVVQRPDEVVDLADPFLEQVAEPRHAVGEQLEGVVLLDVLGQHHDPRLGELGPDPLRGVDALGGERGRHPDVGEHGVGPVRPPRPRWSASGSATVSTRSMLGGLRQQPRDAFADEVVVVGEDDAHGHGLTVGARGWTRRRRRC